MANKKKKQQKAPMPNKGPKKKNKWCVGGIIKRAKDY